MARRKPRPRNRAPTRPEYLPVSRAAANAAGQVLIAEYGEASWLLQIVEMVQAGVDRGIRQLSTPGPRMNVQGFDNVQPHYTQPARSAEEIRADLTARRQKQPEQLAEAWHEDDEEQTDVFARLTTAMGLSEGEEPQLILPPTVKQDDERTEQRNDSHSVPWV